MLKVSVKQEDAEVTLEVEGRLAGAWVAELEQCWQREEDRRGHKPICIRLCAVTFIDDAGKQLLERMFARGAKLNGNGCMVRAILAGITGGQLPISAKGK